MIINRQIIFIYFLFLFISIIFSPGAGKPSQPASVWHLYGKSTDRFGRWCKDLQAPSWKQVSLVLITCSYRSVVTFNPLSINRSRCIFSCSLSMYFLLYKSGEFVWTWKNFILDDYFLYSHNLYVWLSGDMVRRN